jgi:hypothetical protein
MLSASKFQTFTRIGFAARGVMYFLIGYLALRSGGGEDASSALEFLDGGAGKWLLALMAAGFLAYGIWRLSEALIDTEGHGNEGKGIAIRLGGAVSGLIHLGLALTAVRLATSSGGGGGSGGDGGAEQGAATALSLPGGQLLLWAAAIILLLTGLYQLVKAARADFLKHLDPAAARQEWVKWLGRLGYAARGIVFVIMGWFILSAARAADASEAGDMGAALGSLSGSWQMVVAAGLLMFGLFSLVEAVYRRITDPQVLERLKPAMGR